MVSNRSSWLVGLIVAFITWFFGTILAFLQGPDPSRIYVSALWDALYGLGWQLGSALFDQRAAGIAGGMVWPVIVFLLLMYSGKQVAQSKLPPIVKCCLAVLLGMSLIAFMPFESRWHSPIPSFAVAMTGAY